MTRKSVTIQIVADRLGISKSTVSRVLSDSPRISLSTKKKVLKAMKDLGYYPNEIARSLANKRTNSIGIVMPSGSPDFYANSFFQESIQGISDVASEQGYDLLLSTNKTSELEVARRFIRSRKVEGIILMRSRINDEAISFLRHAKFPFVLIGTSPEFPDVSSVDNDNMLASYQLAAHIISAGRRRLAFIEGSSTLVYAMMRLEGYEKALADNGLQRNSDYIITEESNGEKGYSQMSQLLDLEMPPDGVMIADDAMCMGIMKSIRERGLRVPDDIAVGSFNDGMFSRFSSPPITSISVCSRTLGEKACHMLIGLVRGEPMEKRIIVRHELLTRGSTE
jgi:DNA-binding LacI/PurR family transcriptional regulator